MKDSDNGLMRVYPNTCDKCPERGEIEVFGAYFTGDMVYLYDKEQQEKRWRNIGWPTRCKPCNAKAQAKKRANKTIARLEELRMMVFETFEGLNAGRGRYAAAGQHLPKARHDEDRWCYLKFVTLTWKNELSSESEPNMKKARKWLQKKRIKIADRLDVLAGTDVLECVTTERNGSFSHNVHSHGVWLMPYHPIEHIGMIMKKYVGRDECRAIKPKTVKGQDGEFIVSAFAQARNYIMKYLSKQPNTRRSSWGFARKGLTAETFYGEVTKIHEKWRNPIA